MAGFTSSANGEVASLSFPFPPPGYDRQSLHSTSRVLLLCVVISSPQNDKRPEHGSGCMKMVNVLIQVYFLFHYVA